MGATLLNRARIGSYCVIGAGALVAEDKIFDDGTLAVGTPARMIRTLTDEQRKQLETAAKIYVDNGMRYRDGLKLERQ